jgi:hypothetical protein
VVLFLNFLTGIILVVVAFVLRLLSTTRDLELNVLDYIFRLIPFFSFNYGVINLCNMNLYKLAYTWPTMPSVFASKAVLWDMLYLIFMSIFFTIALIIAENSFKFSSKFKSLNISSIKKELEEENNSHPSDTDVIEEEKEIE